MSSDVWFGVNSSLQGRDFAFISRVCLMAEDNGFDLFTVPDHFMDATIRPNPNVPRQHPLDSLTTLAGLAAITRRIKLGPLVACYACRAPTVMAKISTTIDIISEGRFIFGVGAGWHESEFKGFLGRFPSTGERLRGLKETVEICRMMFTNEWTTYKGNIFKVENVLNSPLPVQRPLPILIGGGGEKRTLKIAAKHADISHFSGRNIETLTSKLKALKRHCDTVGRDYEEIRKGTGFGVILGHDEKEANVKLKMTAKLRGRTDVEQRRWVGPACGTPEKVAEALEEYVNKGIRLMTLTFYYPDDMTLFAERVIPLIR